MRARGFLLLAALLIAGCGSSTPTSISPPPAGPETANTTVDIPVSGSSGLQTVEGDGFSIQVSADWMVIRAPTGIAVSTPIDFSKEIPPVQLTFAIIAVQPPLVPAEMTARLVDGHKMSPNVVESESPVTVGGKEGTRLITTTMNRVNDTSDEMSTTRHMYVYVPLDAAVLSVQSVGLDEFVAPVIPQFDEILASLAFK